jgi:hypothetical protein
MKLRRKYENKYLYFFILLDNRLIIEYQIEFINKYHYITFIIINISLNSLHESLSH